eukprot:6191918-Pleurochrysis_carterae.AAC.1
MSAPHHDLPKSLSKPKAAEARAHCDPKGFCYSPEALTAHHSSSFSRQSSKHAHALKMYKLHRDCNTADDEQLEFATLKQSRGGAQDSLSTLAFCSVEARNPH